MLAAKGSSSTTASDCNGDGEAALLKAAAQTRHHSGRSAGAFSHESAGPSARNHTI